MQAPVQRARKRFEGSKRLYRSAKVRPIQSKAKLAVRVGVGVRIRVRGGHLDSRSRLGGRDQILVARERAGK